MLSGRDEINALSEPLTFHEYNASYHGEQAQRLDDSRLTLYCRPSYAMHTLLYGSRVLE